MGERIKKVYFPVDYILQSLQPMQHWQDVIRLARFKGESIPADAKIEHVYFNQDNRGFCAIVSHPSFDEVDMYQVPHLDLYPEWFALQRDADGAYREGSVAVSLPTQVITDPRKILSQLSTALLKECRQRIDALLASRKENFSDGLSSVNALAAWLKNEPELSKRLEDVLTQECRDGLRQCDVQDWFESGKKLAIQIVASLKIETHPPDME